MLHGRVLGRRALRRRGRTGPLKLWKPWKHQKALARVISAPAAACCDFRRPRVQGQLRKGCRPAALQPCPWMTTGPANA